MFGLTFGIFESDSSTSFIWTGGRTMIWFHGTNTVRVKGRNGARWNCNVIAPPPLTKMSNLLEWGGKMRKILIKFHFLCALCYSCLCLIAVCYLMIKKVKIQQSSFFSTPLLFMIIPGNFDLVQLSKPLISSETEGDFLLVFGFFIFKTLPHHRTFISLTRCSNVWIENFGLLTFTVKFRLNYFR